MHLDLPILQGGDLYAFVGQESAKFTPTGWALAVGLNEFPGASYKYSRYSIEVQWAINLGLPHTLTQVFIEMDRVLQGKLQVAFTTPRSSKVAQLWFTSKRPDSEDITRGLKSIEAMLQAEARADEALQLARDILRYPEFREYVYVKLAQYEAHLVTRAR